MNNENNIWPLAIIAGVFSTIIALEAAFQGMANVGNLQVPSEKGYS